VFGRRPRDLVTGSLDDGNPPTPQVPESRKMQLGRWINSDDDILTSSYPDTTDSVSMPVIDVVKTEAYRKQRSAQMAAERGVGR